MELVEVVEEVVDVVVLVLLLCLGHSQNQPSKAGTGR